VIAPLTLTDALAIVRGRVEKGWLEELLSDPDGVALLSALCDQYVALDAQDAQDASSLFVATHSAQVDLPAQGPSYATTTLAVTLRKPPKGASPLSLPDGTRVQTADGHVYLTGSALTFAPGELGLPKTVSATALLPGHPGAIPPGEITQFTPVANGISGVGLAVNLVVVSGTQKALRFTTDTTKPHPFKTPMIGLLLEVTSVATLAAAPDLGQTVQITAMNNGSGASPSDASSPENAYAWSATVDTATDARYAGWYTGAFGYEWRLVDWGEYLGVTNTTAVSGGRGDVIGEIARARGRPRQTGEDDEQLRGRLLRAPDPPSPIGLLRKAIVALVPYGFGRLDVRVYEMGEPPPDATVDPYWFNFPAAGGFIADLHVADMDDPNTPDAMASYDENYNLLASFVNPGLALVEGGATTFDVVVRWTAPGSMLAATAATIRRLLYFACKLGSAPGTVVNLYEITQWGY
jgi:hypothetical protein